MTDAVSKENSSTLCCNMNVDDFLTKKPVFERMNLDYYRDEKNGYATLVPKKHPEVRETVINPTAKLVLELCDGKRNIKDICSYILEIYPGVKESIILPDLVNILLNYSRLGIIDWKEGGNPFLCHFEEQIKDDYEIMLAQEDDIIDIFNFLKLNFYGQTSKDKGFIRYVTPFKGYKDYNEVSLRQQLFAFDEDYFLLRKNGNMEGLLSISTPEGSKSTSSMICLIYLPVFSLDAVIDYSVRILPVVSVKKISKIKFFARNDDAADMEICSHLTSDGFNNEGTLKKEIDSIDLNCYSYYF